MEEVADAVADVGFVGCAHAKKARCWWWTKKRWTRWILDRALSAKTSLSEGIHVNGLGWGEPLRIGPVLLQVSAVCTPCDQLEKIRPGLRREIYGRRGVLCQVLQGGTIRAGDAIARVAAASS
jgi:hypothetical protein